MTRDEIYVKLNEVFREVFDDESITVNDATTAQDIEKWDSLMHITLISYIEDAFEVRFPIKVVRKMQNVGEMVDALTELMG